MIVNRLTSEAFQAFGDVIDTQSAQTQYLINGGTTTRFHDLAKVQVSATDASSVRSGISIFRGEARVFPLSLSMLERHPLGSQAFFPLNQRPYLVVVAPALDSHQPDIENIKVFWASSTQGVNYAQGTWHHPLIALDDISDFLVIDRIGTGNNCDEYEFDKSLIRWIERADFACFSD
ncbi:ureidoglycolate lyase [Marinomonas sp. 15G1-11]|uniref:Ureidoglycolate lyase n=1 Tax=Marinomonas phaeophyticola TaxID=3004091 RepID=A0ABT4JX27_9GAMM|nr:ureidoglycolate lyase [Marinomonas sp. 15G1-11]MCZ2722935.1 ureidoglycolate lyase [Marinomonas sp. 15G1-11]